MRFWLWREHGSLPAIMASFRLSIRARAQLIDIYDFTEAKFGAGYQFGEDFDPTPNPHYNWEGNSR
jgi:hypothetical protein